MEFDYIDWDEEDDPRGNVVHIEAAGVTPAEVEEVLNGDGPETISRARPHRPAKFGWTESGKYLFVVYERSEAAGIVVIYPVTAYEVDPPWAGTDGGRYRNSIEEKPRRAELSCAPTARVSTK